MMMCRRGEMEKEQHAGWYSIIKDMCFVCFFSRLSSSMRAIKQAL